MTALADTNLFIRFFTQGNAEQHQKALALFQKVQNKKAILVVRSEVIAEVIYVLKSSVYKQSRSEIAERLVPLLRLAGIRSIDRVAIEQALMLYAKSSLDFVDALLIALAQTGKVKSICSFDEDFKNIDGIEHLIP